MKELYNNRVVGNGMTRNPTHSMKKGFINVTGRYHLAVN